MTRDDIISLAKEAGWRVDSEGEVLEGDGWHIQTDIVERFANLVAEAEREACAKVCEPQEIHDDPLTAFNIAAAIRARGLTSLRRQLIDAGALQSDPAGLKARGQV